LYEIAKGFEKKLQKVFFSTISLKKYFAILNKILKVGKKSTLQSLRVGYFEEFLGVIWKFVKIREKLCTLNAYFHRKTFVKKVTCLHLSFYNFSKGF
jgi:hypothetical protein